MDPEKHRNLLALAKDESASGLSALRASSRSPSFRRLSLRKSRPSSSSCSTTDSISIHSTDSHISPQSSCVTRDTLRDECAFHRFMVWVAVKRNACDHMTPSERLECPLLRCRKRFSSHEQMLQHLYACDKLESGEYWCYDCGRAERFTDAKCKRCLGHPTKRGKVLSMAKNFFTSLGHKSKKDGLLAPLPEDYVSVPPPSYDSLDISPGSANELCSAGEIHEIDSTEVTAQLRPGPVIIPPQIQSSRPPAESEPSLFYPSTAQQPPLPWVFPTELGTRTSPAGPQDGAVASWINNPVAYMPFGDSSGRNSMEERRMKTRSKTLAPSSSLRSNASNSSTNTTNSSTSTDSAGSVDTVSTGISSAIFGEPWSAISSGETELESPFSNVACPSGFDEKNLAIGPCDGIFDEDVFMPDIIPELPADLPLPTPVPVTSDSIANPQHDLQVEIPSEKGPNSEMTMFGIVGGIPNIPTTSSSTLLNETPSAPNPPPLFSSSVEPSSLVESIWETLQAHVSSSKTKLRPMKRNNLATQFLSIDCRTIASYGHATLKAMLQGRPPESPLHLLCYLHVAYAYFLVVHQEDAPAHSRAPFSQTLDYVDGSGIPSQAEYLEIACGIWKPDGVDDMISTKAGPLKSGALATTISSATRKGKERSHGDSVNNDALLAVVRHLLDELEYSIQSCNATPSLEILKSELGAAHAMGDSLVSPGIALPALQGVIGNIVNFIIQRFGSDSGLASALQLVHQRGSKGYIRTARHAELELLQAAHGFLPLITSINEYAPFVRQQCDVLYSAQEPSMAWRRTHYNRAIDLIESIISGFEPTRNTHKSPDSSDLDEFWDLSTPFIDSGTDTFSGFTTPWESGSSPTTNVAFSNTAFKASTFSNQPSPHSDRPESNSTTPQSGPNDAEPRPPGQKAEADACCDECGYRPKGDPQWFKTSMAKHKRTQHSGVTKIFRCPYPGCTSQYKNREDNLRQHQENKGHYVNGEGMSKRPSKRKKI